MTRRLVGVSAEMSPNVLAYNMKRVMKIIGTEGLLKAMAALKARLSLLQEALKRCINALKR
jgi:hypothetical protein